MSDNLNFRLQMWWGVDDTRVMDARCSAVVCYETALAFLNGSFAGPEHKRWVEDQLEPMLYPLMDNPRGDHKIEIKWTDPAHYSAPYKPATARVQIERAGPIPARPL